jgi:hypothetical protein
VNGPLWQIVLRTAAAAAVTWVLWRWLGTVALAACAPLFGVLLARPLIDLAGDLTQRTRALALRDVQGHHYAFKGHWLHVVEDDDEVRWVCASHLRKVLAGLPSGHRLLKLWPQRARRLGRRGEVYLADEAVLEMLAKATAAETLRFRVWVERELVRPARMRRARLQPVPAAVPPAGDTGPGAA